MIRIEITEVTERQTRRLQWMKMSEDPKHEGGQYQDVEREAIEKVERQLLRQELDAIDIPAVIRAVNSMGSRVSHGPRRKRKPRVVESGSVGNG